MVVSVLIPRLLSRYKRRLLSSFLSPTDGLAVQINYQHNSQNPLVRYPSFSIGLTNALRLLVYGSGVLCCVLSGTIAIAQGTLVSSSGVSATANGTGSNNNPSGSEVPAYFPAGSTREEVYGPAMEGQSQPRQQAVNRYDQLANDPNLASSNVATGAPQVGKPVSQVSKKFTPGQTVAVVGEEYVLAGDLLVFVEPQLMGAKDQLTESQIEMYREKMMRQVLIQVAQSKMLAQFFIAEQVAGKPLAERQEAHNQLNKRITEAFFETVLPSMMEQQKVDSQEALDATLRAEGSSLPAQFKVFRDTTFSQEAIKKHVPKKIEIDLLSMRDYYEEHVGDWKRPSRARFRQMTVLFNKSASREEAFQKIQEMYAEVLYGGASFEAVAKRKSEASRASDGGLYDWVTQGSLRSEQVDNVVFSIPVNKLSQIFEDSDGWHFVMVIEREAAYTIPFENAQEEVREILVADRKKKAKEQLLEKLRKETLIYTLWPEDIPNSRPLAEICPPAS